MKRLRDSLNSTTIVPIHAERSEVLNFLFRSTLFTHFFRTRNQGQKGTKSILSWKLWPIIYRCKSEHTLLGRKRIFFLQLWEISMNLKIIEVLIVKENLSAISDFLAAWFDMSFFTAFFSNEPQIKEESNTYKKRPQG